MSPAKITIPFAKWFSKWSRRDYILASLPALFILPLFALYILKSVYIERTLPLPFIDIGQCQNATQTDSKLWSGSHIRDTYVNTYSFHYSSLRVYKIRARKPLRDHLKQKAVNEGRQTWLENPSVNRPCGHVGISMRQIGEVFQLADVRPGHESHKVFVVYLIDQEKSDTLDSESKRDIVLIMAY